MSRAVRTRLVELARREDAGLTLADRSARPQGLLALAGERLAGRVGDQPRHAALPDAAHAANQLSSKNSYQIK
jgi:hypothetical protein